MLSARDAAHFVFDAKVSSNLMFAHSLELKTDNLGGGGVMSLSWMKNHGLGRQGGGLRGGGERHTTLTGFSVQGSAF